MLNLVERRLATITPKEAASILAERNHYDGQRPLRQSHVDYLAGKMKEGLFHCAEIAYAKLPDGRWVMVNGQHSCSAGVQSGIPFNASIYGYECQSESDVFELFSEIDRGVRRSQTDITRAGRQIMSITLRNINAQCVGQYGSAILMAPKEGRPAEFRSRAITPQNRVAAVCANPEEAQFLHRYYGPLLFNRVAVRMAMIATFRADADRARLFWDSVIQPDHLPAADPRKRLHNHLLGKECVRSSAFAVRRTYLVCLDYWDAHATGSDVAAYDPGRTTVALKPTAPVPVLATVKIMPRLTVPAPQTFTAAMPTIPVAPAAAQ